MTWLLNNRQHCKDCKGSLTLTFNMFPVIQLIMGVVISFPQCYKQLNDLITSHGSSAVMRGAQRQVGSSGGIFYTVEDEVWRKMEVMNKSLITKVVFIHCPTYKNKCRVRSHHSRASESICTISYPLTFKYIMSLSGCVGKQRRYHPA